MLDQPHLTDPVRAATPPVPDPAPHGVPVVHRPDGRVQVGSSPRSAVVLTGPALSGSVEADHGCTPGGTRRSRPAATGTPDEGLAWAAYDPHGPLPGDRLAARARASVAVTGSPLTADVLLQVLTEAGVGGLRCDRPQAVPSRVHVPAAAAGDRPADLVVLVHEHAASPVLADGLLADGIAHLSVVLRDTDALVGPLVVPGRSACLRCLDRHRADADPHWPPVREALTRAGRRPTDSATARVVAGIAALQVLAHLDGAQAETLGSTLEVLLPEGRVRARWWRPHPGCGCTDLPVPG